MARSSERATTPRGAYRYARPRAAGGRRERTMERIKRSVVVQAPAAQVFEFVSDPRNFPEIWPSMIEVSNLDQESQSFDWTYKMAGMKFHGRSKTVDLEPNRRRVVKGEGGISSTFTWLFQQRDDGTEVTLEVEYEIPGSLLRQLTAPFLRRLNEREAETTLENLKERLESTEMATQGESASPPSATPPAH
jgi:carbon monoxide dehydrogenase subunit G